MLASMSEEKKRLLEKITWETPVAEMPDCVMKYEKILYEA